MASYFFLSPEFHFVDGSLSISFVLYDVPTQKEVFSSSNAVEVHNFLSENFPDFVLFIPS